MAKPGEITPGFKDYVPANQEGFDEMKAALAAAPRKNEKFALLLTFKADNYDNNDIAVIASTCLGAAPQAATGPPGINNRIGARLGKDWRNAAAASFTSDIQTGKERVPQLQSSGILGRSPYHNKHKRKKTA